MAYNIDIVMYPISLNGYVRKICQWYRQLSCGWNGNCSQPASWRGSGVASNMAKWRQSTVAIGLQRQRWRFGVMAAETNGAVALANLSAMKAGMAYAASTQSGMAAWQLTSMAKWLKKEAMAWRWLSIGGLAGVNGGWHQCGYFMYNLMAISGWRKYMNAAA